MSDDGDASCLTPTVTLVPADSMIRANESVAIAVYTNGAVNVAAYEAGVDAVGGESGDLELVDVFVEADRKDFVFRGVDAIPAADKVGGRLGGVSLGDAVDAAGQRYLGTFVFRATPDARGMFHVGLRGGNGTFLRDGKGAPVSFDAGAPVAITVRGPVALTPLELAPR